MSVPKQKYPIWPNLTKQWWCVVILSSLCAIPRW